MPFVSGYTHSFYSREGSGDYSSGSGSTDTFMGVEWDSTSSATGNIYGAYNTGTNTGTSRGVGFPSQSFYTTAQALGEMNISKHDVSINNMQSIKNKISDIVNLSTIDNDKGE